MLIFFHKTNALQKEENDMWKKLKNWIAIGMLAIATCLNCNVASAKGTEGMDSDDLIYECDDVTFQDSGTLLVEGTFYNLSSDYDVIGLEDIEFSIVNNKGKEIESASINRSNIELIAHDGSTGHAFELEVNGNAQQYKNSTAILEKITFTWAECEGKNCRYCGGSSQNINNNCKSANSNTSSYSDSDDYDYWIDCFYCKGSGTCNQCNGSGRKSNGRMCTYCDGTGDCPRCEGLGERKLIMVNGKEYVVCAFCHGSTICASCDGSGNGYYYRTFGMTSCYSCKGSGICNACRGKGYTNN